MNLKTIKSLTATLLLPLLAVAHWQTLPGAIMKKTIVTGEHQIITEGKKPAVQNDVARARKTDTLIPTGPQNFVYPKGFPYRPFNISKLNGLYISSMKPIDIVRPLISSLTPYYVNYALGKDSATYGQSPARPLKTFRYAILTAGAKLIYDAGGVHKIDSWGNIAITGSAYSEVVIIGAATDKTWITSAPAVDPTWTNVSGTIYTATVTSATKVNDLKYKDEFGGPLQLSRQTTSGAVDVTPNSYFITGSTVRINLPRTPDANILVLTSVSSGTRYLRDNGLLYVSDLTFMGGLNAVNVGPNTLNPSTPTAPKFVYLAERVNYVASQGNGLNVTMAKLAWSYMSKSFLNFQDGFNYNANNINFLIKQGLIIEDNCESFDNGLINTGNSVFNGSSVHNGIPILRIGGSYHHNNGPNVIDVTVAPVNSAVQSLNIGVQSYNSKAVDNPGISNAYPAGFANNAGVVTSDTSRFWCYDCYSKNDVTSFKAVGDYAKIYNYDPTYDGAVVGNAMEAYIPAIDSASNYIPIVINTVATSNIKANVKGQSAGYVLLAQNGQADSYLPKPITGDATINSNGVLAVNSGSGANQIVKRDGSGNIPGYATYSEGTWTLTASSPITISSPGKYTKIGNQVTLRFGIKVTINTTNTPFTISGLPFSNSANSHGSMVISVNNSGISYTGVLLPSGSSIYFNNLSGTNLTAAQLSDSDLIATVIYNTTN